MPKLRLLSKSKKVSSVKEKEGLAPLKRNVGVQRFAALSALEFIPSERSSYYSSFDKVREKRLRPRRWVRRRKEDEKEEYEDHALENLVDDSKWGFLRSRSPGASRSIHTVTTENDWKGAFVEIRKDTALFPFLGFDVEGFNYANYELLLNSNDPEDRASAASVSPQALVNVEKDRPLMIQLSTLYGKTFLIRIGLMETIPRSLIELLESSEIVKVGVGIAGDVLWLASMDILVKGVADLRNVVRSHRIRPHMRPGDRSSLKTLAKECFGDDCFPFRDKRMKRLAWSNFAQNPLTNEQMSYAAFDSQVGMDIFGLCCQRLCRSMGVNEWGKLDENFKKRWLLRAVEGSLDQDYVLADTPRQQIRRDYTSPENAVDPNEDPHNPSTKEDLKEKQRELKAFQICFDGMVDSEETLIPGMRACMGTILDKCVMDGGRLPLSVRKAVAFLGDGKNIDWKGALGEMERNPPSGYGTSGRGLAKRTLESEDKLVKDGPKLPIQLRLNIPAFKDDIVGAEGTFEAGYSAMTRLDSMFASTRYRLQVEYEVAEDVAVKQRGKLAFPRKGKGSTVAASSFYRRQVRERKAMHEAKKEEKRRERTISEYIEKMELEKQKKAVAQPSKRDHKNPFPETEFEVAGRAQFVQNLEENVTAKDTEAAFSTLVRRWQIQTGRAEDTEEDIPGPSRDLVEANRRDAHYARMEREQGWEGKGMERDQRVNLSGHNRVRFQQNAKTSSEAGQKRKKGTEMKRKKVSRNNDGKKKRPASAANPNKRRGVAKRKPRVCPRDMRLTDAEAAYVAERIWERYVWHKYGGCKQEVKKPKWFKEEVKRFYNSRTGNVERRGNWTRKSDGISWKMGGKEAGMEYAMSAWEAHKRNQECLPKPKVLSEEERIKIEKDFAGLMHNKHEAGEMESSHVGARQYISDSVGKEDAHASAVHNGAKDFLTVQSTEQTMVLDDGTSNLRPTKDSGHTDGKEDKDPAAGWKKKSGGVLYDAVLSYSPCWRCGERRVERIVWEPIVPLSYLQMQVNNGLWCACNSARVCTECVLLWRQRVYSMQIELGAALDASLEIPKWIHPMQYKEMKPVIEKLEKLKADTDAEREAWKEKSQKEVKREMRKSGQWNKPEKKPFVPSFSIVQRRNEIEKEVRATLVVEGYVVPAYGEDIKSLVLDFMRKFKAVFSSALDYHEFKVLDSLDWDLLKVCSFFRDAFEKFCMEKSEMVHLPATFVDKDGHMDISRPELPSDPQLPPPRVSKKALHYIKKHIYEEETDEEEREDRRRRREQKHHK